MILSHDLLINSKTWDIFANLDRTPRIVDVGAGIRPCPAFPCDDHVCIEPCEEYVEHLSQWAPIDRKVTVVHGPADLVGSQPRQGTTVFLLDVIEHMERDGGIRIRNLIEEFEHAIIFTPLGWMEQGGANPDGWGLNGGDWQRHRSAWMPEDFVNWKVRVWEKWEPHRGAILAIR